MYFFSGKDPGGLLEDPEAGVLRGWPCLKADGVIKAPLFQRAICKPATIGAPSSFLPLRSDDRAGSPGALPLEALHLEGLPQEELPLEG